MSHKSHFAALQEIRSWNTNDVICALKNNGLEECTEAVKKREVNGDKLLELSEVTLGLWKCDLTIYNIRKLASFVQDISKSPAKFVCSASSYGGDSWDTDFDDDDDEESLQKTGSTKSRTTNGRNGPANVNKIVSTGEKEISEVRSSVFKTSISNHQPSKVIKSNTIYSRRKLNIPSVFASEKTSNTKTHELSASTSKLSTLKADMSQNKKEENAKPSLPTRPASLYSKSSLTDTTSLTLPKPPVFDKEGSVLREICQKLTFEHDIDEYESIDDELLLARTANNNNNNNTVNENGFVGPQFPVHPNNKDSPHRTHLQSSNPKLNVSHIPESSSEDTKSSISAASEDKKMNGLLNVSSLASLQKTLLRSEEEPKNHHSSSQDFQTDVSRKSPVPLPPRNEVKREASPVLRLHSHSPKNVQRENGDSPSPVPFKASTYNQENMLEGPDKNENLNTHTEEFYEIIPEDVRSYSSKSDDNEYHSQSKRSPTPPSLPPKPICPANDVKSSGKSNKSETNATSGSFWSFGSTKDKVSPKEKTTQDAKRTNTLPMPRPANSYVNDLPRASASRPLPPPPLEGGVQRPVKIPLVQMPWYFNIDRKKAEEMLRNSEDGMFVIRPSTQTQNPLTLTLKYGTRSFNICVRHRPDGRYALGTAKPTEQTFSSVEELVNHYTDNELLLYSNRTQAGTIRLTSPPRKEQLNMSLTHSS